MLVALVEALQGAIKCPEYANVDWFTVWLGRSPIVFALTPAANEAVLSSNKLIDKAIFYDFLYSWLGHGLLTSFGAKWQRHRKMLTPSFHFKILDDFLPIMTKQTRIFIEQIDKLRRESRDGVVSIASPILLCALDTICGKP